MQLPEMPPPELFTHELLDHEQKPTGVHLGVNSREVVERAYDEGETSKEIREWYSAETVQRLAKEYALLVLSEASLGASADADRAAGPADPSPSVSAKGDIPSAMQPIETAPDDTLVVVAWMDADGQECHAFDYREDGCWMNWHDRAEHVEVIGGHGVSYTAPYTHWLPIPPLPQPPKEQA
jgi:hypothetical protein